LRELNTGADTTVLFGPHGAVHTFSGADPELRFSRTLPGYRVTPPAAAQQYMESPTGMRSRFDDTGRLIRIEASTGRHLSLLRDGAGRVTGIQTEAGEHLVSISYVGPPGEEVMEITLPHLDPTTISFDGGCVRRIDGPRGGIELDWTDGVLRRIRRDDGVWTAITWSGTDPRKAVTVEQSHGARDRYRYGPGDRHVYTDPDGQETVYTLRDGRIESVHYPGGLTRTWRFDANGALIEIRDNRGGGEDREYDAAGRLIATERTDGTWTRGRYDSRGRLVRLDDDRGLVFERELRLDGSVAAWTTADGVRYATFTQQSDRDMTVFRNGAPYLTITLDRYGNPATVHRADGRREDIETSLYGTVTRRMVDGVAVLERVFDRAGRLLTVVDADGETCYSYDGAGNVSQILLDGEILQSTEFDPAGRPRRSTPSRRDGGAYDVE
jgi:YD repeat-containing protein